MGLVINAGEMLEIKVGVDLGGGDIRMAKQFLNAAQVLTGFQ